MEPHRIADDLERHEWYAELAAQTIADIEAFLANWAAFEQAVAAVADDGV